MEHLQPKVIIVRLGHRPERDKRVTSHVALTSRAFGATGFILAGECDTSVAKTILETEFYWGRGLRVTLCGVNYYKALTLLKRADYRIVHLTMYGIPLEKALTLLSKERKIAVVVGSEKVPPEIYSLADYNVAVGNQPHSEVAAIAVFLDRLYNGKQLNIRKEYPRLEIEPSPSGKHIVYLHEDSSE